MGQILHLSAEFVSPWSQRHPCERYLALGYDVSTSIQYLYTKHESLTHLLALDSDRFSSEIPILL